MKSQHKETIPIIPWAQRGALLTLDVGYEEESLFRILVWGLLLGPLKKVLFYLGTLCPETKNICTLE